MGHRYSTGEERSRKYVVRLCRSVGSILANNDGREAVAICAAGRILVDLIRTPSKRGQGCNWGKVKRGRRIYL